MDNIAAAEAQGYRPVGFDGQPFPDGWPNPMTEMAYHGPLGDVVQAMEPHSEADPAALLVQLLVGFGSVIGPRPHWIAGADRHRGNLFAVLVGPSSKGRKGSGWSMVESILRPLDHDWAENRVQSGVSSGEGLIHAVRDATTKRKPIREGNRVVDYEDVEDDPGEADKRLLAFEPEWARVLRVATREGNTVSAWLRQSWDGQNLGTLTRSPLKATRPHVSMVGHITRQELRRELTTTDAASGFGNRFLWVASTRSKSLPEGGQWFEHDHTPVVKALTAAVNAARTMETLRRDDEAAAWWRSELYERLMHERPGLFGAVTSRAEAQAMRLAMLYAVADRCRAIQLRHLQAAVAVWTYCEQSAHYVFGDAIGDPVADAIIDALRGSQSGLTRTAIRDLFQKHADKTAVESSLSELERLGLARCSKRAGPGRHAEVWDWCAEDTRTQRRPGAVDKLAAAPTSRNGRHR